jgi:uncharacterized membrane protein HdeD (DUF308 family)
MDMLEYLSRYWWTLAVRGALAVLFGLAALLWPGITLRILVWLYGFYAVVDGLLALAALIVGGRLASGRRGWLILEGVVGIAAGVFAFLWPTITGVRVRAGVPRRPASPAPEPHQPDRPA